jgi:tRNA dimethylallyltransferase
MALSAGVVEALVGIAGDGMESAEERKLPLAVLLLGPTGSGKTALSLALGERFGGEIVSCDSVAVYRGMDVGSAKPSKEEQARLPHHLIDVAEPSTEFTAGEYARQGRAALQEIAGRGRLPIVTGGTGLYLRALTEGLFAGPKRQDELRDRLRLSAEKHGAGWLHRVLQRMDRASSERIHANDQPKLIRAIEVCIAGRKPMSEITGGSEARNPLTGFRLLRIGLAPARVALYERINARAAGMFARGLVEETRGLLERYGRVRALDALGYRQAVAVVDGALTQAEAVLAAQQGHRNYAKRQGTWFRREPEVHWIEGFGDAPETVAAAIEMTGSRIH